MNKLYRWLAPLYDLMKGSLEDCWSVWTWSPVGRRIVELLGLRPGMRLLEVSPGPGYSSHSWRHDLREEGRIVALDLSMPMLRQCQARQQAPRCAPGARNASYLPFADESFDALFHFGGVNLFSEPDKALAEFVRVVRRDGLVSYGDEGFGKSYRTRCEGRYL